MTTQPIIIVDTREQRPFEFSPGVRVEVRKLEVGDYSLAGLEDKVVVERKTLGDLLGSITHDRERFIKELRQLRAFSLAALVVEASWSEILLKQYRNAVHPNAVLGSLMAFVVKYGVVPILAGDHVVGAQLTERLLLNFARLVERDYRALAGGNANRCSHLGSGAEGAAA